MHNLQNILEGILDAGFDINSTSVNPFVNNIIPISSWRDNICELDMVGYNRLYELGNDVSAAKKAGLIKMPYREVFHPLVPGLINEPCIAVWEEYDSVDILFGSTFIQIGKPNFMGTSLNCIRIRTTMSKFPKCIAGLNRFTKSNIPRNGSKCYNVPEELGLQVLNNLKITYTKK